MKAGLANLLNSLTPAEQAEVETFAAFLLARRKLKNVQVPGLARRKLKNVQVSTDDVSLLQLVADSGGFAWLDAPEEDVYSAADGDAVQWLGH